MNAGYYFILFAVVLLGGMIAHRFPLTRRHTVDYFLSFSAAFLFGIVAVHLIPLVGKSDNPYIGVCILLGFLIQIALETLTQGAEHCHEHRASSTRFLPLITGLLIHAFLEGLPLDFYSDIEVHQAPHTPINSLFWGILIHKFPAAYTLGTLLSGMSLRGTKYYLPLILFALATPLGAALPHFIPLSKDLQLVTISIVIGFMLHIATSILYEMDKEHHSRDLKKGGLILLGMGLAALSA